MYYRANIQGSTDGYCGWLGNVWEADTDEEAQRVADMMVDAYEKENGCIVVRSTAQRVDPPSEN